MNITPLLAVPLLDDHFPLPVDHPFTTKQALGAGLDPRQLRRLLDHGLVRRMVRGVYVATQVPDSVELRAAALGLVVPRDCVVTDWTACWLLTGVHAPGDHVATPPVSMFRAPGQRALRNGLVVSGERRLAPGHVERVHGIWVTTSIRTAWDLGRLQHRDVAIGGMDALARLDEFTLEELVGGVRAFRGERGVVQLRDLAPRVDPRSESTGESTLRLRWTDLTSVPHPEPQVPILGPDGKEDARLDLGVRELRYAMEYDGQEFHSSEEDRAHDEARRRWLLEAHGWIVEGVRRENVYGYHRDVDGLLLGGIAEARATLAERLRRAR